MPDAARQYHTQQTHYIRRTVTIADGSGTAVYAGTIPRGAIVLGTTCAVTTVFNSGTSDVVIVGTLADDDALVAAAGFSETAVGVTRVAPATLGGLLSASADTDIYTKWTGSGTAATTGVVEIIVEFAPDNDK